LSKFFTFIFYAETFKLFTSDFILPHWSKERDIRTRPYIDTLVSLGQGFSNCGTQPPGGLETTLRGQKSSQEIFKIFLHLISYDR
jgi:hypothetical protein